MAATLYDPAFATLHAIAGASYRRVVTILTLFGGFASTVFWPLSQILQDAFGWRATLGSYAVLHLVLCLPLHLAFLPRVDPDDALTPAFAGTNPIPMSHGSARVYFWLALALALASFLAAAMSAHMIGLLTVSGLSAGEAVLTGALIGPMQVAGRIVELAFARRFRPIAVGTFAFALLAASLAVFTQVSGRLGPACVFAALYGWSNGVLTIVRSVVPGELLGPRDYGALLGRLAFPQLVGRAAAPVALAGFFAFDGDRALTPWVLLGCALIALLAYQVAIGAARRR
jgi:predicted MFS family arabinose efflux permease